MEMFAIWTRPKTTPMSAVRTSAADTRVDVTLGVVVGEDRRGDSREVDLGRVGRLEDLVAELELDRAPESRELAARGARAHEIVERVEEWFLVQGRERVPVAKR